MQYFFLACLLVVAVSALAPLHRATDEDRISGEYVIVFRRDADKKAMLTYMEYAVENNVDVDTFEIGDMSGAFVKINPKDIAGHLVFDNAIDFISENRIHNIGACSTQYNSEWNLERISERLIDLGNSQGFTYDSNEGFGVTSYIIDTGILTTHTDFGGRASWGTNTVDSTNSDCNGHGTHVASTVAGTVYGVAKSASLVAVKVLNCQGSGSSQSVINGIRWVTTNARKPANANMSLGGGNDAALVAAVEAAIRAGVVFVVAAGNSNANACNYSPANAPNAITVGSTAIEGGANEEQLDVRSSFSNWGNCVDIFGPGSLITAAWIGSNTAVRTISGTSMASPHVCGAVTLLQGVTPAATPAAILTSLVNSATSGVIDMRCTSTACNQSPNLMVYTKTC